MDSRGAGTTGRDPRPVTGMDLQKVNGDFNGPFVQHLGLRFTEASGDRVVASWTVSDKHRQRDGIVHGGVHASVVEAVGGIGALAWLGEGGKSAGANNSTDFYRAVSAGVLVSTGVPIHRGRSQQVWLVETRDDDGRLVARGQLRVQNLRTGHHDRQQAAQTSPTAT